jgi:shikimate kinase
VPANRTIVALYDCLTVWLDTSFDTCWQRIEGAKAARPLAPDRETAQRRFEERRDSYALAERRIEVEAADSAKRVVEKLFRET